MGTKLNILFLNLLHLLWDALISSEKFLVYLVAAHFSSWSHSWLI